MVTKTAIDYQEAAHRYLHAESGACGIILQPEAVAFFKLISKDRAEDDPLLRRSDGSPWSRSHQQRRMALALELAGLDKEGTI